MKFLILGLTLVISILGLGCTYEGDMHMDVDDEGLRNDARPPRTGWAKSGTLVMEGNKDVSLQAEFGQPGTYTAAFRLDPQGAGGGLVPLACVADIEWSVAGNSVQRRVTVTDGMSISGSAEAVRIVVRDATFPSGGGGGDEYQVDIVVAKGVRAASSAVPFLLAEECVSGVLNIAAGGTAVFVIPRGVGVSSVRVLAMAAVPFAPLVNGDVLVAGSIGASELIWGDYTEGWIPLLGACDMVRVRNNSASSVNVTVLYGIDG